MLRQRLALLASLALFSLSALLPGSASAADPFAKTGAAASGAGAPFEQSSAASGGQEQFLPVEKAYQLAAEYKNQQVVLHWTIAEGYYLYRHRFGFATADGAALKATLSAGKPKEDEFFGHVEVYYHEAQATLDAPSKAPFVLQVTVQGCADAGLCYPPYVQNLRIDPATASIEVAQPPAAHPRGAPSESTQFAKPVAAAAADTTLWLSMLAFAALGGVILNLMPCVFPVLSLKVLSFADHRGQRQGLHGIVYMAGVVASFLVVAAVLLALKAAGQAIGWGFQLQEPWFVGALAYLFFAMGLSLSGFWELGGQWMGAGGKLTQKTGYSGSFFTGVLATLVASPCTAPFMGSALGFAITQPPLQALSVFAALGVGMALPVLILSFSPRLLARFPKPGAWMERFKQALAFPLYATAVWLSWVVGRQTGASGMAGLLAGAVALTLALWLWRFGLIARSFAAAILALALGILGSPLLQSDNAAAQSSANAEWQPYRPETLATLRAAGKPVFLDLTAAWCITCLANEKVALSSSAFKDTLVQQHITYLKGDWTHYDPAITALLAEFGRSGIPFYVFFPAGTQAAPVVLPQLLTPQLVIAALTASSHGG